MGNGVVNMSHWFNFLTFDIIGDLAFGESFDLLKDGIWKKHVASVIKNAEHASTFHLARCLLPLPWQDYIIWLLLSIKGNEHWMFMYNLSKEKLTRRMLLETEKEDFGTISFDILRLNLPQH